MKSLVVYDPPMCCSSGTCGPSPNKELVRVASDLRRVSSNGIEVSRYSLSQQPDAFMKNEGVWKALNEKGQKALPITVADGEVRITGRYPTSEELDAWMKEGSN